MIIVALGMTLHVLRKKHPQANFMCAEHHGFRGISVYFVQCPKPITYFIYMLLSKEETSTLKKMLSVQ